MNSVCLKWVLTVLTALLVSSPAKAQDWFLFQGILDAELYKTDADSSLLTRNNGDIAALGRLHLWTAFKLAPSLQFYALGELEIDNFSGYSGTSSGLQQLALRYTHPTSPSLMVEAGKILSPLAAYSERRLSTQNPLIAQPYLYTTGYPWGAKVVGSIGWFDYQVAYIDPSGSDSGYQIIEPDSAYRPALSFGVTPFTGLRVGYSWTQGPYLNREVGYHISTGHGWRDYDQRSASFDFQFSRGYLEFNGLWSRTQLEVPYHDSTDTDTSYYLELKYTWTPRLYSAVRFQSVEASYVDYRQNSYWYKESLKFRVLELGIGYRFSPDVLLKVAYETDHWDDGSDIYESNNKGHALGLQVSWALDFVSLFSGEQ